MKYFIAQSLLTILIALNLFFGWDGLAGNPSGFPLWCGFVNLGMAAWCFCVLLYSIRVQKVDKRIKAINHKTTFEELRGIKKELDKL